MLVGFQGCKCCSGDYRSNSKVGIINHFFITSILLDFVSVPFHFDKNMAQEGISSIAKYTWIIKNFTKCSSKRKNLYSDVFVLGGYKWKLSANPKGGELNRYLSLHLAVAYSSTLPEGWSIDIESFSITVVNQLHSNDSIEKIRTKNCRFDAKCHIRGFVSFLSLEDLHDPAKGYLVDDTLVIEARLCVSAESFSNLLNKSKNLLAELSSMDITTSSSESILPPNPQSWQQQRKALDEYLALSLEAFRQAIAFDEIERIAFQFVQQHSSELPDQKIVLENLVSRLRTFKEMVLPTTKPTIENAKALRISLSGKSADVGARLDQGQERLSALETNFSNLVAEEVDLEAEFLRLTTRKEKLLIRRNIVAFELDKISEQVSTDLDEWRDIVKEVEEADQNWFQRREKLNFKQVKTEQS